MNVADMIGQYIQCRDWIEASDKAHAESQKTVRERMTLLEAAVAEKINELGGESVKTEQGTAYRSTLMATKVADRDTFMRFVFDGKRENFLTSAVSKDAVKEYLEENNGQLPPGIDVTYIFKTNFRRS